MKIILCNKYFFLNGGTEKYLSDIMEKLTAEGHTPVPFSVRYAGSWESPYSPYFLPAPGRPDQAHLKDIRLTPSNILRFLDRSIYSFEAQHCLNRLLNGTGGADIAYVLNIYNYMSPSILTTFRKRSIPVVMQIGDYNLLCPRYDLLRNGRPCTLCAEGTYHHGLRYRCVKNHFLASSARIIAMYVYKWLRIYDSVQAFIVPCTFMRDKLIEGGFPEHRIHLLRYPVVERQGFQQTGKGNYLLYFGRISYEKGLDTLIEAFQLLQPSVDLVIAGRSYDGEQERLLELINPEHRGRIHFPGFKKEDELAGLISGAIMSIVPSRWYDNAPISIYESLLHGTPVVASRIGGIPEQIVDGVTGRLFSPGSSGELAEALRWMLNDRNRLDAMGKAGRKYVTGELSIDSHIQKLTALFDAIIKAWKK